MTKRKEKQAGIGPFKKHLERRSFKLITFLGLILNVPSLFDPLSDYEIFNDEFFWSLPKEMSNEHQKGREQVINVTRLDDF